MPPPFSVRSGVALERNLGQWDDQGNITIPGNITAANFPAGASTGVQSVAAADSTVAVSGTPADPKLAVGTIAESQVTGLVTDLAAKAPIASPTFTGTATADELTVSGVLKAAALLICTSGTRPTDVQAGQAIYETDTGGYARYDGSTWRYYAQDGAVSPIYRGAASSVQSIGNAADTTVAFGTNSKTSPLVTKATQGAGHDFTLNRGGVWSITATVRCAASATGERFTAIYINGGAAMGTGGPGASTAVTHSVSLTQDFVYGDKIRINYFQSSGGSLNLDTTATGVKINITWLHG